MRCQLEVKEDSPCAVFSGYRPYSAYYRPEDTETVTMLGDKHKLPEPISGCHKSPILTLGINPNLAPSLCTGFDASRMTHPYSLELEYPEDIRFFWECMRNRTIFQGLVPEAFVLDHIDEDSVVYASNSGTINEYYHETLGDLLQKRRLKVRSPRDGRLHASILYDGESDRKNLVFDREFYFMFEENFEKGDMLVSKLLSSEDEETLLEPRKIGYYATFQSVLDLVMEELELDLNLEMGEDVCQGDVIACATPGCLSGRNETLDLEIQDDILEECLMGKGWVVKQIEHIKPKLIVFSGKEPFKWLFEIYGDNIVGGNLHPFMSLEELVERTVSGEYFIDTGDFSTRIIVSTHFSYRTDFVLKKRIAKIVQGMIEDGSIEVDRRTGHFVRNEGSCNLCENECFTVNDGCKYGKSV